MKVLVVIVLCGLVGVGLAEPPRFRSSRLRSRVLSRQELAPADDVAPPPADAAAPYPPSGWKPDGATLDLPTETEAPVAEYGPPPTEYGPPASDYGPPAAAPEDVPAGEPEAEAVDPVAPQSGRLRSAYLLLVPPSALQRVQLAPQRAVPAKLRRARF